MIRRKSLINNVLASCSFLLRRVATGFYFPSIVARSLRERGRYGPTRPIIPSLTSRVHPCPEASAWGGALRSGSWVALPANPIKQGSQFLPPCRVEHADIRDPRRQVPAEVGVSGTVLSGGTRVRDMVRDQAGRGQRRWPVAVACRRCQKSANGSPSLNWSARSCSTASLPASDQNFSLPLTRWLICLTADSIRLLVIGSPSLRYASYFILSW